MLTSILNPGVTGIVGGSPAPAPPGPSGPELVGALKTSDNAGVDTSKTYITPGSVEPWKYNSTVGIWVPETFASSSIMQDNSSNPCLIDVPGGDDHTSIQSRGWTLSSAGGGTKTLDTPLSGPTGYIRLDTGPSGGNWYGLVFSGAPSPGTTQLLVCAWIETAGDSGSTWGAGVGITSNNATPINAATDPDYLLPGSSVLTDVGGLQRIATGAASYPGIAPNNNMVGPQPGTWGSTSRTLQDNYDPKTYPFIWHLGADFIRQWNGTDLGAPGVLNADGTYVWSGSGTIIIGSYEGKNYHIRKFAVLEA